MEITTQPTTLHTISFIRDHSDWREKLTEPPYCLKIVDEGSLTILKYNMINEETDWNQTIVQECRGLIIENQTLKPICVPFFKFFNYGEVYAHDIDWSSAKVQEKIDGSLIKLYFYKGQWRVATNGTIDASKALVQNLSTGNPLSFYDLFQSAATKARLDWDSLNPSHTYCFELTTPYNRVVVPHQKECIYHIGTRDTLTLQEIDLDIGIEKPKTYQLHTLSDIIEAASELPWNDEGYVVVDQYFHRIKIKSPAYVAVHRMITGMNEYTMLELIRTKEEDEFFVYFSEYKKEIEDLKERIRNLINYLDEQLVLCDVKKKHDLSRKEHANWIKNTALPEFVFLYLDGKVQTGREWLFDYGMGGEYATNQKIIERILKYESFISKKVETS